MTLSAGVASHLQALPGSLMRLHVNDNRRTTTEDGQPSMPPQLQQLTPLQELHLQFCALQPVLLASVTQLLRLRLQCCSLLPDGHVDADAHLPSAGAAALLAVLPRLTKLQRLQLEIPCLHFIDISDLQAFSALTSSSSLQKLAMPVDGGQAFPPGAAEHIFPAGRQLPCLQHLDLSSLDNEEEQEFCLNGEDLARIVACCPSLQHLNITNALEPGADVSMLLQLPASCTSLDIGGAAFTDAAAPVLAQLTQLRELAWTDSPGVSDQGIKQLTALRRLDTLLLMECSGLRETLLPRETRGQAVHSFQTASTCLETSREEVHGTPVHGWAW